MALKSYKVLNEQFKTDFLTEYGVKWDSDKALFTQYVSARYQHMQADMMSQAIHVFGNNFLRMEGSLSSISGTLTTWPKKGE